MYFIIGQPATFSVIKGRTRGARAVCTTQPWGAFDTHHLRQVQYAGHGVRHRQHFVVPLLHAPVTNRSRHRFTALRSTPPFAAYQLIDLDDCKCLSSLLTSEPVDGRWMDFNVQAQHTFHRASKLLQRPAFHGANSPPHLSRQCEMLRPDVHVGHPWIHIVRIQTTLCSKKANMSGHCP